MKNPKATLLLVFIVLNSLASYAQQDSTYYVSYAKLLTGRFFFSQKFTSFQFQNTKENYRLVYRPNTTLNMGIGASHKGFTLNIAYGFPFLNPDGDKGKTKYLDLQFHAYSPKFTLDFLGQFYKGFYLYPKGSAASPGNFYKRPDMRVNIVGGAFQYIFNHRRFSLRAPFFQTEWQKKSAGSPLAGFELYTGRVLSDSTITPTNIDPGIAGQNETRLRFFEMGPNIGYAYTLVMREHFFLTGSASFSLTYSANTLTDSEGKNREGGFSSNAFTRIIGGYNSERWGLSLIYINNGIRSANNSDRQLVLNTGNVRVSFVHRFVPGPKEKKILKVIK